MKSLLTQVSNAIRILRWNRDVSARASHLVVKKGSLITYESVFSGQAGSENVSGSTVSFERKLMSTKTTFKRVAAVAAAALTIGGLTAVSAFAAPTINSGDTTESYVTGTYHAITFASGSADKMFTITTSGVGSVLYPATGLSSSTVSASSATSEIWSKGTGAIGAASAGSFGENLVGSVYSATAGTQTIKITGDTSAAVTITITWGAAPTFSSALSTSILNKASTGVETATADATVVVGKTAVAGSVKITINDQFGAAYNGTTVSATIAGSGLIALSTSGSTVSGGALTSVGTKRSDSLTLTGANVAYLYVSGDSTAGTGTITISVTDPVSLATTVLATETVTFTGSASAAKAQGNLKVLKAGGSTYTGTDSVLDATTVAGTAALTAFVTDSNGNPTTGTVKIVSSDSTVLTAGSCQAAAGTSAVVGEYNCVVNGASLAASGASATITFEVQDALGAYTILATPVTFTIGGAIAKTVLSTDADSYTALAPIKVVVTSTDSKGNAAYDQDVTAVGTIVSSIQLGGTLASPAKIIGGTGSKTGAYAPAGSYTGVTISGTDSTAAENAISATFNVVSPADTSAQAAIDAAQEATDAANAAYDAANNAMDSADAATAAAQDASDNASAALAAVTSLSATVAKLVQSVASIAAALAKIQKKLKA